MKIWKCLFGLTLILTFLNGCQKDNDGMETNSTEDYQIRPIFDNDFILTQYPIDLLERSTCERLMTVTTDEEGIFSLSNFAPKDLILATDIEGRDIWSLLSENSFRVGQIIDAPLTNFSDVMVRGLLLPTMS